MIIRAATVCDSVAAATEQVRRELDIIAPGTASSLAAEIEEARAIAEQQVRSVEILHLHSVLEKRKPWYFGPKEGDRHWPRLRSYLAGTRGWATEEIDGIDQASNEVVSLLENPGDLQKAQFQCRGLVVGHVQSGKTANMTAVIAKALDAGYNTVIVLAGLTNKLRYQTQLRIYKDLVCRNKAAWQLLTSNDVDKDFRVPAHGGLLSHSDKAQLAIVKKNVSPLRELQASIEGTLPAELARLRVLVIDDECDQASVNQARGEMDVSAINQRIREILKSLPSVSYVGYTATPFANVLIDPYPNDDTDLDDLYPRDFITALPEPERYFGTRKLFGTLPQDADNLDEVDDGLDMIRIIPENEIRQLQPIGRDHRHDFAPDVTPSLETALLYFLACCAARCARGDGGEHMTMLVHTSIFRDVHSGFSSVLEGWIDVHRAELRDASSPVSRRLADLWEAECSRLPAGTTAAPSVAVDELLAHVPEVLERLEFPVENGASDDRIDYTKEGRIYVVVGGSILSRGLTLEGLMVSYFLRTAKQYDTLLQMGRWFGYRPRYEDLPRIWMPEDLRLQFRSLASIEDEIRADIARYTSEDKTPMEVAVRIRAIPGMAITAASKMRAARRCAVSYWGTHRQTIRFNHRDLELLNNNWTVGAELLDLAEKSTPRSAGLGDKLLWTGVPRSLILRFLKTYRVEATHGDLRPELLVPFIESSDPRLAVWNVGVVESSRANREVRSARPLGAAGHVRMVNRSKLRDDGPVADIKALMSRRDVLLDCGDTVAELDSWDRLKERRARVAGNVPLLLLYAISAASAPDRVGGLRVALDASHDVLGIGIVFPGSVSEGGSFVSLELRGDSQEDVGAIEEEEAAMLEAAGVR